MRTGRVFWVNAREARRTLSRSQQAGPIPYGKGPATQTNQQTSLAFVAVGLLSKTQRGERSRTPYKKLDVAI